MLIARQQIHLPDRIVGEILFHVGEAGNRLAFGKVFAVAQPRVAKHRDSVAKRASDLAGLVELDELAVESGRLLEGEHRALPAGDEDGVVGADIDRGHIARFLDEGRGLRRRDKAQADDVAVRIAAGASLSRCPVGAPDGRLIWRSSVPAIGGPPCAGP
jgi:hypothetical protein